MPDDEVEYDTVHTADGRALEVLQGGDPGGRVLVFHSGTPTGSVPFPKFEERAAERGLRVVTYCRPGYGNSTPQPGRSVADASADTAAILDALGVDSFLTLGWSGGGPHALACAALLPGRCQAAAILGGVAPYTADGLAWTDGMGPENIEEFDAAAAGVDKLTAFLENASKEQLTAEMVAEALGGLVSDVDRAALRYGVDEYIAAGSRRATLHGIAGWRDDDLAFAADWGFDVAAISVPFAIWHGGQDLMVPFAHGHWIAEHAPSARAHLLPEEGHISLILRFGEILDELVTLAP